MLQLLNEILSIDIHEEKQRLESLVNDIKKVCLEYKIPFAYGEFQKKLDFRGQVLDQCLPNAEYLEWLRNNSPAFLAIIPIKSTSIEGWDMLGGTIKDIAKSNDLYTKLIDFQATAKDQTISFELVALYSGLDIIVRNKITSKLSIICSSYYYDDSYYDDEDEYDEPNYMSNEDIRNASILLAKAQGFNLAKNQGDRVSFARKTLVAGIEDYDLTRIAKESSTIYKMEVLPERVSNFEKNGMDIKEIALTVGESIARVKQIIASLRTP